MRILGSSPVDVHAQDIIAYILSLTWACFTCVTVSRGLQHYKQTQHHLPQPHCIYELPCHCWSSGKERKKNESRTRWINHEMKYVMMRGSMQKPHLPCGRMPSVTSYIPPSRVLVRSFLFTPLRWIFFLVHRSVLQERKKLTVHWYTLISQGKKPDRVPVENKRTKKKSVSLFIYTQS